MEQLEKLYSLIQMCVMWFKPPEKANLESTLSQEYLVKYYMLWERRTVQMIFIPYEVSWELHSSDLRPLPVDAGSM